MLDFAQVLVGWVMDLWMKRPEALTHLVDQTSGFFLVQWRVFDQVLIQIAIAFLSYQPKDFALINQRLFELDDVLALDFLEKVVFLAYVLEVMPCGSYYFTFVILLVDLLGSKKLTRRIFTSCNEHGGKAATSKLIAAVYNVSAFGVLRCNLQISQHISLKCFIYN